MKYISVKEAAEKWSLSERTVRGYCSNGRVKGAILKGKTWNIPESEDKPTRLHKRKEDEATLLDVLRFEKSKRIHGGIYHKVQIELTYNSNHIEGSKLTHDETRYIFETNTIGEIKGSLNVDDIVETSNHFACVDLIINKANCKVSETLIKRLHAMLKGGTADSRLDWFKVGEYKALPNEVGGMETTLPKNVKKEMKELLREYNDIKEKTLDDLLDFHYKFEKIHPFQDGNGRVGRLLLFKECLKYNIVPFIIDDENKIFYYRGLKEWKNERGYLRDTCLSFQDKFKKYLDYFNIPYDEK